MRNISVSQTAPEIQERKKQTGASEVKVCFNTNEHQLGLRCFTENTLGYIKIETTNIHYQDKAIKL